MELPFPLLDPEEYRKVRDRHEMLAQDARNRVRRVIDELTPEQLVVFRTMFEQAASSPHYASYMEGVLAATMIHKFPDLCENCGGESHDAPENLLADAKDDKAAGEGLLDDNLEVNPDMLPEAEGPAANLEAQFKEYNVRPVDPGNPLGQVVCLGCDLKYVSLEDRMLQPPGIEGCRGCILKQKWG